MRDPNRIRKFCNALADIWESQCPDWRFGQLVCNVIANVSTADPFFVEDDTMLEGFRKYFNFQGKVSPYDELIKTVDEQLTGDNTNSLFSTIAEEITHQIISDDENPRHVGRDFWYAFVRNPEAVDDALTSLCGWSMMSILVFAGIIPDTEGVMG